MKKIAMLGGTFNPIHKAHTALAKAAMQALSLDQIIIIPTKQPPHKSAAEVISGQHRLEMCRLAASGYTGMTVSAMELLREEPSYTVLTLQELQSRNPQAQLYLIVGSDMLFTFEEWRDYQEIFKLATICCAARVDGQSIYLAEKADELRALGAQVQLLDFAVMQQASSQIRQMLQNGEDASQYVEASVLEYIQKHGLYRTPAANL